MREEFNRLSREVYANRKPMIISQDEKEEMLNFLNPVCHICEKVILDKLDIVLDHDHLSSNLHSPSDPRPPSNVRGLAHCDCNLAFSLPNFIPIIFHNGSKYDFKFLISSCVENEMIQKEDT